MLSSSGTGDYGIIEIAPTQALPAHRSHERPKAPYSGRYTWPTDSQSRRSCRYFGSARRSLVDQWTEGALSGDHHRHRRRRAESRKFALALAEQQGWRLLIAKRRQRAFKITGLTWIVERSFAWLGRNRRLSKDYDYRVQTSETMIDIAAIRLMLNRLAKTLITKHPLRKTEASTTRRPVASLKTPPPTARPRPGTGPGRSVRECRAQKSDRARRAG